MSEQEQIHDTMNVEGGAHIKMWTRGVPVEAEARAQLEMTAKMPFIFKHIAVMPDVHVGKGSTVGSVIPTLNAVIPAAVGVDIGCGMMAAKTTLAASDLPDNLGPLRTAIEGAVPHGRTPGSRDPGAWSKVPGAVDTAWAALEPEFGGPHVHSHVDHTDSFYVLSGEVGFTVDEQSFAAGAGTFVAATPGVEHTFTSSPRGGRLLNIHAPSTGFHDRLREMSR